MNKETRRKLVHIIVGTAITSLFFLFDRIVISVIIILLIGCTLAANQFPKIYNYIIREKELDEGMLVGVVTYTASALLLTLMFDPRVAGAGILSLAWGDGLATLLGKKYGRLRINKSKTIVGSATVLAFTIIGSLAALMMIPTAYSIIRIPLQLSCGSVIISVILSSILTMINELFFEYDNINVPLTQAISLSILLNLL